MEGRAASTRIITFKPRWSVPRYKGRTQRYEHLYKNALIKHNSALSYSNFTFEKSVMLSFCWEFQRGEDSPQFISLSQEKREMQGVTARRMWSDLSRNQSCVNTVCHSVLIHEKVLATNTWSILFSFGERQPLLAAPFSHGNTGIPSIWNIPVTSCLFWQWIPPLACHERRCVPNKGCCDVPVLTITVI